MKLLSYRSCLTNITRWFKRGVKELASPGIHITAAPPFVYVSTQSHSHICYRVNGPQEDRYQFEQHFTDSRERSCTQHAVIDIIPEAENTRTADRLVLVTDKTSSSITALRQPHERTYKNASETLFEAVLPHTVIRLQRGDIRPPWRKPTHANTVPGVLTDDIIGACSDGTIYTFSILSQPARRLLRLIQNLIQAKQARDPAHHFTPVAGPQSGHIFDLLINGAGGAQDGKIRARDVDPAYEEGGLAGPRHKHVDGDLLVRWREEGGRLESLLFDGGLVEKDVVGLFVEYGGRVDGFEAVGADKMVVAVERWFGDVLMPML